MYERKTKEFLRRFGVGNTYRGFFYCAYSVRIAIENPDWLYTITKSIYPEVARRYRTSTGCVERDIRTVAEVVWKKGGKGLFEEFEGVSLEKRPSNSKFLEFLVDYIVSEGRRVESGPDPCSNCTKLKQLEDEKRELEKTVDWMHEMIWKLIRQRGK